MKLGKTIDLLCDRFKIDRDNGAVRAILRDKINLSYKEICNVSNTNWKHLERNGEMITIPNYSTGTCSYSYGSRTVTFSGGASITSAMAGRFWRPAGTSNWYKINYIVSSTEITLLSPVQEISASNSEYTIWKRYYYFPSEVKKVIEFGSWILNGELVNTTIQQLNRKTSDISLTGEPEEFLMVGSDSYNSDYTAGTISLTKNSNVVTGTNTAWLGNVEPGDIFDVNEDRFRVKRVESDTRIILLNAALNDLTDSAYIVKKDANLGFQLWFNPNTAMVLPYIYQKRVYDMVNEDYDIPEVPEDFDIAILDGAEAGRLSDLDDVRYATKINTYAARITDLKSSRFVSEPRLRSMPPRILNRGGYI